VRTPWVSTEVDDAVSRRRLSDGRTFHIVKVFYEPAQLEGRLRALGWSAQAGTTPTFFLYGTAARL
jgi:hypothetical protein